MDEQPAPPKDIKPDDLLESLIKGFGSNLNITSQELDLESLNDALRGSEKDTFIREALEKGLDLKQYYKNIEAEIVENEWESVGDYLKECEHLTQLHYQIQESDKILSKLGTILKEFESDLGNVSTDIESLQHHSRNLNMRLLNRAEVRDRLANTIQKIIVPPDLIQVLLAGDINESYVQAVRQFDNKLHQLHIQKQAVAAIEIQMDMDVLRFKIVRKVRDFLMTMVLSLRKPKTNIQILQQNVLFKYAYLNKFLYLHEPLCAAEVRDIYVETVARTFTSYFRSYITNLSKLQYQIADAEDLLGAAANKKMFQGSKDKQSSYKSRASVFSLSTANTYRTTSKAGKENSTSGTGPSPQKNPTHVMNRMSILYEMENAPVIVPHVALQNELKYSYEHIFRSMYRLLVDTISSEQLFDSEWFPRQIMADTEQGLLFAHIFNKILTMLLDDLHSYLSLCFDPIGLLIMVLITRHCKELMRIRQIRIPPFIAYLQHVESLLWDRFNHIMELNTDSVRTLTNTKNPSPPQDIRPHYVTRRYSELCASLHTLNSTLNDQRVNAWLVVMRTVVERLLEKIAEEMPDIRNKTVFLINNWDLVLTVLREHEVERSLVDETEDMVHIRQSLSGTISVFIEEELAAYYKKLIAFIKETDSMLLRNPAAIIDREQVEQLSREFSVNWKEVLANINSDAMNYFSNFQLGSEVLKKALSQFVLYYKRFEEIHRKCFRSSLNPNMYTPPANTPPPTHSHTHTTTAPTTSTTTSTTQQHSHTVPPMLNNVSNNNNTSSSSYSTSNNAVISSSSSSSSSNYGKSFVPLSTITYEITKKYSSFTL